jgi:FMN phosphatase YigB (HAD superfamily)
MYSFSRGKLFVTIGALRCLKGDGYVLNELHALPVDKYLITDGDCDSAWKLVKETVLGGKFDPGIERIMYKNGKNVEGQLKALKETGTNLDHAVLLDTSPDNLYYANKNLGIKTIAFVNKENCNEVMSNYPDKKYLKEVVSEAGEIPEAVRKVLKF